MLQKYIMSKMLQAHIKKVRYFASQLFSFYCGWSSTASSWSSLLISSKNAKTWLLLDATLWLVISCSMTFTDPLSWPSPAPPSTSFLSNSATSKLGGRYCSSEGTGRMASRYLMISTFSGAGVSFFHWPAVTYYNIMAVGRKIFCHSQTKRF